jgi:putative flippase GtrA
MGAPIPKVESTMSARLLGLLREVGLYGAASVAALLTDMGVLAFLVSVAHVHYLVASAISFTAGGVLLYVLSVTLVFGVRRVGNRRLELVAFLALGGIGLLVNAAVISVAVEAGHAHFMVAKGLAAGFTFGTNFCLRRLFLFTPAHS